MSQLVLDEQLKMATLLPTLRKWITVERIQDLRPNELIPDERVPAILLTLRQPTFVTIDRDFWDRTLCHPDYGILYFPLQDEEQILVPDLLRALLRHPEFQTRADRMGKVARVSRSTIDFWQFPGQALQRVSWHGLRQDH